MSLCLQDQHTERTPSPSVSEEPLVHSNGEDELDRDSGSKSESEEQEEECTGSMGSTPVALDPVEKEWIYSAACGRLSDLAQLLQQEPSLANKKDFTSTALHWAAKHGKEDMANMMANAGADVNTKSGYTPLHIAALHGHRHILELLIGTYGAKENLRDYSGHLACQYLNIREPTEEDRAAPEEIQFPEFHVAQARDRSRNRKLTSLFQSKKKWGSAEELAPVEEERVALAPHQLMVPAFRPRKFSRQDSVTEEERLTANELLWNSKPAGELPFLDRQAGQAGGPGGPLRPHKGGGGGAAQRAPTSNAAEGPTSNTSSHSVPQLSACPSQPNECGLSLTQQRAVNQSTPRREQRGGTPAHHQDTNKDILRVASGFSATSQ
ncbi:hypothetical protein J4Q44_G00216160 [Coregonus suidteri]|uniref:Ankyrin repeat domain-containing protein SOWAHC-like n=1 Tax=Coregonus suidteri TaxID=861788 RepID=A0AAN8QLZ2_9TELE